MTDTESASRADPAVVVDDVWRNFGSSPALQGVVFRAAAGDVTGMVGPNGAGKTTLLLILSTLLAPDRGQVRIGGLDPSTDTAAVRRLLGWVPDAFGFYENLTTEEYLEFAGRARLLTRHRAHERAHELLGLVRLGEWARRPVHVLSRGQKQRLAFASALVHDPAVLLLDEPSAGLDPSSRAEFLTLVRRLADAGTAVVISSHLLADLEQVADRVVFIDRGVTVGERHLVRGSDDQISRSWRLHALDDHVLLETLRSLAVGIVADGMSGVDVQLDSDQAAARLVTALVNRGVAIVSCGPVETSLESTYLELTAPE